MWNIGHGESNMVLRSSLPSRKTSWCLIMTYISVTCPIIIVIISVSLFLSDLLIYHSHFILKRFVGTIVLYGVWERYQCSWQCILNRQTYGERKRRITVRGFNLLSLRSFPYNFLITFVFEKRKAIWSVSVVTKLSTDDVMISQYVLFFCRSISVLSIDR